MRALLVFDVNGVLGTRGRNGVIEPAPNCEVHILACLAAFCGVDVAVWTSSRHPGATARIRSAFPRVPFAFVWSNRDLHTHEKPFVRVLRKCKNVYSRACIIDNTKEKLTTWPPQCVLCVTLPLCTAEAVTAAFEHALRRAWLFTCPKWKTSTLFVTSVTPSQMTDAGADGDECPAKTCDGAGFDAVGCGAVVHATPHHAAAAAASEASQ